MGSPGGASPGLGNANQAGTVFVVLPETVPEELDVNPSVLVEETLFAALDGHDGGLRTGDYGLWGQATGSDLGIGLHANETVLIGRRDTSGNVIGILPDGVSERSENVFSVRLKVL